MYRTARRIAGWSVTTPSSPSPRASRSWSWVFTVQPSPVNVTKEITPAVIVTALDQFGNNATDFTGNVDIAIGNDPSLGTATLGGTKSVPALAGVATFGDLTIDVPGIGYTLVVSAGGVSGAMSDGFTVLPLLP